MAEPLGDLQLLVMGVIWKLGDATVAEAHQELLKKRPLAYTTVLSTLRNLERRGYLQHTVEGKAHRFYPDVSRDAHTSASVHTLIESLFGGRPERLMSHLLGSERIDARAIQRIRTLLAEPPKGAQR